jgi:electron transfer DM13
VIGFVRRHVGLVIGLAVIAAGILVFVLVWFQPQKLVIEDRVNEAAPAAAAPTIAVPTAAPKQLQGSFRSFEHPTSGRAVLIETKGKRVLRFENFETSNGPDVVVWLSTAFPRSIGDTAVARDYVHLGQLKGNIGNQNYDIPAGTDLVKYSSVVVWCRRFNVAFGATKLT